MGATGGPAATADVGRLLGLCRGRHHHRAAGPYTAAQEVGGPSDGSPEQRGAQDQEPVAVRGGAAQSGGGSRLRPRAAVIREHDLGGHSGAAHDNGRGSGAGHGTEVRLHERATLSARAGDGHGVLAGGDGEVAAGVAETDPGEHDLAVEANIGLADLRRRVDGAKGGLAGLDAVVLVDEKVHAALAADGDNGVLARAQAHLLGGHGLALAVEDQRKARGPGVVDLVAARLGEGGRKFCLTLLHHQRGGACAGHGMEESDLRLVRLRLRKPSWKYDRSKSGRADGRALYCSPTLHLAMLTRDQEIGRSLRKADPEARALLDLSLRRRVKDDVIAAVLRLQPEEVAPRREAALDRLAWDLGIHDRDKRANLPDELTALAEDQWPTDFDAPAPPSQDSPKVEAPTPAEEPAQPERAPAIVPVPTSASSTPPAYEPATEEAAYKPPETPAAPRPPSGAAAAA